MSASERTLRTCRGRSARRASQEAKPWLTARQDLIRRVPPATCLVSVTLPLRRAAEGYARLEAAKAVVVMLSYDEAREEEEATQGAALLGA